MPALVRRYFPAFVFVVALAAYYAIYHLGYASGPPVRSDGEGYYAYLPSYLVNHDDSFVSIINSHLAPARTGFPPSVFGFSLQPTGHWLDKYPVGEAILLAPFFGIGHGIALIAGAEANGYSSQELYAVGTAGTVYTVLGLIALSSVLRRLFSDWVVVATLCIVTFGTSVFHYATYDAIFSHAYSFFCVSFMLLLAVRWYEVPSSTRRAALLGVATGAVIAVRLTDVVLVPAILLLGVGSLSAFRERLLLIRQRVYQVSVAVIVSLLMLVPQMITWYLATHHLFVRPYQGESFDFAHPQLLATLFSFDPHGLLPYAPALVLSFAGLLFAWLKRRDIALPVTLAFLPFWYLVAAWWDWSFTAGFGDRAFNDVIPLLALPMALLFAQLPGWRTRLLTGAVSLVLVGVTCIQMINYWQGRLPGAGISPRGFVHILLFRP